MLLEINASWLTYILLFFGTEDNIPECSGLEEVWLALLVKFTDTFIWIELCPLEATAL